METVYRRLDDWIETWSACLDGSLRLEGIGRERRSAVVTLEYREK
jgi:hypothetical protein